MSAINSQSCQYCYIDIDIDNHRSNIAVAAAFVDATDSRYGFSSKDLRRLGGSERSRIDDLLTTDHEWGFKAGSKVTTELPPHGSRIVVRLFWDVAPLACENFAALCANGGSGVGKKARPAPSGESGKPMTYRGSSIHRVVPGFVFQGGDFVFGNGSGGESIYGKKFKDERSGLALKHDRRGVLSMGNSGKNSNTSQFFITFEPAPQCDGKHVVFGEVVSGFEVMDAIERVGTSFSDGGEPSAPVVVTDCGVYRPLATPGAGVWYDRPDAESYTGVAPEFLVRPRVGIAAPTDAVAERMAKALGGHAVVSVAVAMDEEGASIESLLKPLERFEIDVVVIAPSCAGILKPAEVPRSWKDVAVGETPPTEEVFLVAKPLDVLSAVVNKSWVAKRPGWILSGSFV